MADERYEHALQNARMEYTHGSAELARAELSELAATMINDGALPEALAIGLEIVETYLERGPQNEAWEALSDVAGFAQRHGVSTDTGRFFGVQGRVEELQGELPAACVSYARSVGLYQQEGRFDGAFVSMSRLAFVAHGHLDAATVADYHQRAVDLAELLTRHPAVDEAIVLHCEALADCCEALGQDARALRALEQASAIAEANLCFERWARTQKRLESLAERAGEGRANVQRDALQSGGFIWLGNGEALGRLAGSRGDIPDGVDPDPDRDGPSGLRGF